MSEVDPLLSTQKDVYDRFTPARKRLILATITSAGIIAPFCASSFIPLIPLIAKDLQTTGVLITFSISLYTFIIAIGGLCWAPYSAFYGRRRIYLLSLPLACIGAIGVFFSKTIVHLFISRAIQALGASSLMSQGAATISDIYRVEERGAAMGVYFGLVLLGFAAAPLLGGFISIISSWRTTYLALFCFAFASFMTILLSHPETSHSGSRGIDKALAQGNGTSRSTRRFHYVWLNPFGSLVLLRGYPYLAIISAGAFTLLTDVVLFLPIAYTAGEKYNITSPLLLGACLFPSGIGNALGAYISGRLSDKAVVAGRKRRGGEWIPEDRLLATIPGALIIAPLSVLIFGWTVEFIPGKTGLIICLFAIFFNGLGVDIVLAPTNTYIVDILHSRSAEATAVSVTFRLVLSSLTSSTVLPLVQAIGVGPTNTLAAVISLLGYLLIRLTIRHGKEMREWKDIGYTVRELES